MAVKSRFVPTQLCSIAIAVLCLFAAVIPAGFYLGINTLSRVAHDELELIQDSLMGNIDVCEIGEERIEIKGWAFLPGAKANAPSRVLIEHGDGSLFEVKARNVPRPDVDEQFNIDYRNSMVGFHASSSRPPAQLEGTWRVLIIKPDAEGTMYGDYYECP